MRMRMASALALLLAAHGVAWAGEEPQGGSQESLRPEVKRALQQKFPASPKDIKVYREHKEAYERALYENPLPDRQQIARTRLVIDLTDGQPSKIIPVVRGYGLVLRAIGENGAAWPIESVRAGRKGVFHIEQMEGRPDVFISVDKPWLNTNLIVTLAGRSEPLVLFARSTADESEGLYSEVVVVADGVPSGSAPVPLRNTTAISEELINTLAYAPGTNWERVEIDDSRLPFDIGIWSNPSRSRTIVRVSGGQLLGPSWDAQVANADQSVLAYELKGSPVVFRVVGREGGAFLVRVKGSESVLAGKSGKRTAYIKRISGGVTGKPASGAKAVLAMNDLYPSVEIKSGYKALHDYYTVIRHLDRPQVVTADEINAAKGDLLMEEDHPIAEVTRAALREKADVERVKPNTKAEERAETGFTFRVDTNSLQSVLSRLLVEAGWKQVVWQLDVDYEYKGPRTIKVPAPTRDEVVKVIGELIAGYPVRADFYRKNEYVVFTRRGTW